MKTYLKDLTPDEVIIRLKAGEEVNASQSKVKYKVIDGVLCGLWSDGEIDYNARIIGNKERVWYFETPDELKLEVGKCYKTRDGRKAFVYLEVGDYFRGVVEGDDKIYVWDGKGQYSNRAMECRLDLISEWSDDDVAED